MNPEKSDTPSKARPGDEIKPTLYRRLPVELEAIRWSGRNLREVIAFTGRHESAADWTWEHFEEVVRDGGLKIFTLEGPKMATVGDYIIKGVKGECYPCKPDIFWKIYERAAESAQASSAYKCGECGRTQACSDVFCAWAGPDSPFIHAFSIKRGKEDGVWYLHGEELVPGLNLVGKNLADVLADLVPAWKRLYEVSPQQVPSPNEMDER